MDETDSPRFLQGLLSMGTMFSDDVTKPRQKLYWLAFRDTVVIEEWEYACMQAMQRETFHKVPLPAALMHYVREYRHKEVLAQQAAERQMAEAERIALEASPEWQAEQARRRADARQRQAETERIQQEYQAWLAEQPRDIRIALGQLNPPDPSRWLPLTEDFSPDRRRSYTPHGALQRLSNPESNKEGA
jgi:hypothetical protein